MPEISDQDLSAVSETLLLPLYARAIESQRPDALLRDEVALSLFQRRNFDFSQLKHTRNDEESQLAVILRNRQFDRITENFLSQHPGATVVHIGCGLDSRFERVDDGKVEWYDLDLPEVIELRRRFIGGEKLRYHLLPYSMFERAWMDSMDPKRLKPILLLAEGVLMYFEESQVKSFIMMLLEKFTEIQLAFDAFSPFFVWANNRRVKRTQFGSLAHWGLKRGQELESWAEDIHLLDEWYPFLCNESRLSHIRWVRFIPVLAKTMGIFHYQLG